MYEKGPYHNLKEPLMGFLNLFHAKIKDEVHLKKLTQREEGSERRKIDVK